MCIFIELYNLIAFYLFKKSFNLVCHYWFYLAPDIYPVIIIIFEIFRDHCLLLLLLTWTMINGMSGLYSRPDFFFFRRSVYWDNEITKDWSKSDNSTKISKSRELLFFHFFSKRWKLGRSEILKGIARSFVMELVNHDIIIIYNV